MSSTSPTLPVKCLNCDMELTSPIVCTGCRTLFQPPESADYFDLLGLDRRYEIDQAQLASAYRALLRNIHPDHFAEQTENVHIMATRLSAQINQAVSVLKDPMLRASYLLELAGGPSGAEQREVPGNLLAEIMELREEIDEAKSDADNQAIDRLRSGILARQTKIQESISQGADALGASNDQQKQEFRRQLNSVKYFDNLLEHLAIDPLDNGTGAGDG